MIDCVNIWKTSEAANLVFQWIFVLLNSVKLEFWNFNLDPYFPRAGDTGGWAGGLCHSLTFLRSKKNGNNGNKKRVSKQKLLKGCHQGQNIAVLAVLESLKFKNFSCRPPWYTLLFSAQQPIHFEIYFAGSVSGLIFGIIWCIKRIVYLRCKMLLFYTYVTELVTELVHWVNVIDKKTLIEIL